MAAIGLLAALGIGACGGDEIRYGDKKVIERLHLEQSEDGYAIDGDPFCLVDKELLNDAGEVDDASGDDEIGLVVSSQEANVGVTGVAPFAQDCRSLAKKRLNKLDPPAKE